MEKILLYGGAAAAAYFLLSRRGGFGGIALPLENLPSGFTAPASAFNGVPYDVAQKRAVAGAVTGTLGVDSVTNKPYAPGSLFAEIAAGKRDFRIDYGPGGAPGSGFRSVADAQAAAAGNPSVASEKSGGGGFFGKVGGLLKTASTFVTKVQYDQAKLGAALKGYGVKGAA